MVKSLVDSTGWNSLAVPPMQMWAVKHLQGEVLSRCSMPYQHYTCNHARPAALSIFFQPSLGISLASAPRCIPDNVSPARKTTKHTSSSEKASYDQR